MKKWMILSATMLMTIASILYFLYGSQFGQFNIVTVNVLDHQSYEIASFDSDLDRVNIIKNLIKSSENVKTLPNISSYHFLEIKDKHAKSNVFKMYVEFPVGAIYLVNEKNGEIKKATYNAAREYLMLDELFSLYSFNNPPMAKIINQNGYMEVSPLSYTWNYLKLDGNFYNSTKHGEDIPKMHSISLKPDDTIIMEFLSSPDRIIIQVKKDGQIIDEIQTLEHFFKPLKKREC